MPTKRRREKDHAGFFAPGDRLTRNALRHVRITLGSGCFFSLHRADVELRDCRGVVPGRRSAFRRTWGILPRLTGSPRAVGTSGRSVVGDQRRNGEPFRRDAERDSGEWGSAMTVTPERV